MGDKHRFNLFADLIGKNFDQGLAVADVAGGKGYLNRALRDRGFSNVTTFDPRGRRQKLHRSNHKRMLFRNENFDLLVGMHPDGATDVIIDEAAKAKIPFVICPCCIIPERFAFWGRHNHEEWFRHLVKLSNRLGFSVTTTQLRMNGMNRVIIGRVG